MRSIAVALVALAFAGHANAATLRWYWPRQQAQAVLESRFTAPARCRGLDDKLWADGRWVWHRFRCHVGRRTVDLWVTGMVSYRLTRPVSPDRPPG